MPFEKMKIWTWTSRPIMFVQGKCSVRSLKNSKATQLNGQHCSLPLIHQTILFRWSRKESALKAVKSVLHKTNVLPSGLETLKMTFGRPDTIFWVLKRTINEMPQITIDYLANIIPLSMHVRICIIHLRESPNRCMKKDEEPRTNPKYRRTEKSRIEQSPDIRKTMDECSRSYNLILNGHRLQLKESAKRSSVYWTWSNGKS